MAVTESISNINTMNLSPPLVPNYTDFTGVPSTRTPFMTREIRSVDLVPQHLVFNPSVTNDEVTYNMDCHSVNGPVPKVSQMTIFYGGKVFLFNEISESKAREITSFANMASYRDQSDFASAPIQRQIESPYTMGLNLVKNDMLIEKLGSSISTDLAYARRASLLRFLEKRKDRTLARAPYQMSYSKSSPPKENMKSWLGLSSQSPQQFEH